jgi:hopanoid biosynthesis associated RND transporter like protein HpnN
MISLAKDTAAAGSASFVLVVLVLVWAFRCWRLVLAAASTLVIGLVWSAAFAGATIHELNPMSITFGVLVIGLGIDFMIHLGMHFGERVTEGQSAESATQGAILDTGRALVLCAATTGVGFLAFIPTDFRGISDLGMAAAGGMLTILFLTLTLLPALIKLLMTESACADLAARGPARALRLPPPPNPVAVIALAGLAGLIALPLLPHVDLDTNVISMRNQDAESVQTFRDLLESRETTPWYLDALVPSLDRAVALAEQMRALPEVDLVVTLADFVPEDQEEKVEMLADVELMLGLPSKITRQPASTSEQIAALRDFKDFLAAGPVAPSSPLAPEIDRLRLALLDFLEAADREPDTSAASQLADLVLDPLPEQIERLTANLAVEPISQDDLPASLVERMLSSDGHARIQVYPTGDLWDHDVMVRFVESIRPLWSEITGLPVNLVESARATWQSLRIALLAAAGAIMLLLLLLWRSVQDTAIVLGPLLLAVLMTQVSTVVFPLSFNYANVIVLPLLLGIGVDSGIHLVERSKQLRGSSRALLESTTARAVVFSALTTVATFGTLGISTHRGVSSLGWTLVVGMIWTLMANLLLLPALLALRERRRASA